MLSFSFFFDFTLRTEVLKYFGFPLDLMQCPKRRANATVKIDVSSKHQKDIREEKNYGSGQKS